MLREQSCCFCRVLEKEDIITRSALITNRGKEEVIVEKAASSCLDFLTGDYELLSFCGRYAMERNLQRTEIACGSYAIGSRRGTLLRFSPDEGRSSNAGRNERISGLSDEPSDGRRHECVKIFLLRKIFL